MPDLDPFNPYAHLYEKPLGPGDQRPTALQVVQDNELIGGLSNKTVLVTGATAGIGIETARALHATGARVFITARNLEKAEHVVDDIIATNGGKSKLEVIEMDLESLDSVKRAAKDVLQRTQQLNILVNNAGIMACPESRSKDDFELQFAVNHLAHFTLTSLLLPILIASSTPELQSRVVFVSSSSHRFSSVHWDNINLEGEYEGHRAYGQSKTAMIWTANQIERLYGSQGVHALSLNPGGIWTELQRYSGADQIEVWKQNEKLKPLMQSPAQGASTTLWAAVGKVWEGKGGKYVADCKVSELASVMDDAINNGHAPWAYDRQSEERLWKLSCEMTGYAATVIAGRDIESAAEAA